jgi:PAS domain S-box-containing protein
MNQEQSHSEEALQHQNQRLQLFAEVTLKIRQSLQLEDILHTTVVEVQRILKADRALIFQLGTESWGKVLQEAVVPGCAALLGQDICDPCFQEEFLEQYRQGRMGAITDLEQENLPSCYTEFLQQLGVRANLVVPILFRENLWGLLIAHQCSQPRQWTHSETELLRQLADQIGIALSQSQLLEAEIQQRQALERSQAELRAISTALESAVEGISQLDAQGRYIYVNQAYAAMVGYQPEEMIGLAWPLTVHPEDQEKLQWAYQTMLNQGRVEVEARGVRQDGSTFDKQLVMVSAYNQQQQFTGHYCFMKDISDRREIERLKDEFISIVSHELRTPLTSVSGALDLLASGILRSEPEEAQRMLTIAANNTDRLVRMINDILDIERIESGKVTMTKQTCDAAQLMSQAVEELEELADRATVTLSMTPCHTRFWVDPDRILQVLTNLISNAIKFSPAGATVWVTAELQGGEAENIAEGRTRDATQIRFQIRDQGRGIPADKLESIFGRFQQVDASDSRQRGGTGLGLAICRTIVQQHGGQIWAESQLGVGSSFFFTLPCLWEPQPEAPVVSDTSGPLILVCDDDPSVRTVVQTLLESQGYHVLTVASGREAIDCAIQHHPAIILLNLIMPEMDGWQTLAHLKQHSETQHIPVIVLSGLTPDAQQTTSQPIQQWIVKPPDPQVLLEALENALARPHQSLKVLIVEDDLDLAEVLKTLFHRRGIETCHAQTGREAIRVSQEILPDLLVLDLGLPECDGFEVVDWLRQHNRLHQVPLVVYTARDLNEQDRDRLKLRQTLFFTKGRIPPQDFEQRIVQLLNRLVRGQERGGPHDLQSSHH